MFLEVATALQGSVHEVPASLDDDLGSLVVLNLHATPEVKVLDEWTSRNDYPGKRLCRNFLVEFGSIEGSPELAVEAELVEHLADSGQLDELLGPHVREDMDAKLVWHVFPERELGLLSELRRCPGPELAVLL